MEDAIENQQTGTFSLLKYGTYLSFVISIAFFALTGFKVLNRIFALNIWTEYILWQDAMQLAVLWAILGFVSLRHSDN